jgi:hypothetical protein
MPYIGIDNASLPPCTDSDDTFQLVEKHCTFGTIFTHPEEDTSKRVPANEPTPPEASHRLETWDFEYPWPDDEPEPPLGKSPCRSEYMANSSASSPPMSPPTPRTSIGAFHQEDDETTRIEFRIAEFLSKLGMKFSLTFSSSYRLPPTPNPPATTPKGTVKISLFDVTTPRIWTYVKEAVLHDGEVRLRWKGIQKEAKHGGTEVGMSFIRLLREAAAPMAMEVLFVGEEREVEWEII